MPYKRGRKWWITVRGHRQSSGTSDYQRAKTLEHKLNHEAWDAEKLGIRFRTWDAACLDWFKRNKHLKSLYISQQQSGWWEPHLSGRQLVSITGDYVRGVIERERPVNPDQAIPANSTGNLYMEFVRKIMLHANAPFKIERLPAPQGRDQWLSLDDWNTFTSSNRCSCDLIQVATFSISTGLRRGNVIGLQWNWIKGASLQIPAEFTKTSKPYGIPLNKTAVWVLEQRRQASIRSPVHVFLMDGEPIYPVKLHRAWNAALKAADVPHITYHGLRHTFASWMVQAGVPFEIVARLGNWKLRGMVHRYSHFDVESLRPWAERFDEIIGTNPSQFGVSTG